jgi:putative transposase
MFRKIKYRNLMEACIRRSASKNGIKIIEIDVQPEHVHCVVEVSFSTSVSKVFQLLKGGSSRLFFQFAEKAKLRYPRRHLWSRGKFASSVGFVQLDVVRNYVKNQSVKHSTYGNSTLWCGEDVIISDDFPSKKFSLSTSLIDCLFEKEFLRYLKLHNSRAEILEEFRNVEKPMKSKYGELPVKLLDSKTL